MSIPPGTKYIETPERMWELFCAYRQDIWDNPIQVVEQKKGTTILPKGITPDEFREFNTTIVELPTRRPLTLEGFENYCADQDIITDLGNYFANTDDAYKDYLTICKRIRRIIKQDQIEGGMAGIYNPSITQRLNGLVEKSHVEGDHQLTVKVIRGDRHKTQQSASGTTEGEG